MTEAKNLNELIQTSRGEAQQLQVVDPIVSPEEALAAWKRYQALKETIVENSDIQMIGQNRYLKKTYWRKIATFYSVTVEIVEEKTEKLPHDNLAYHFVCKATAPNGRSAIGTGSCDLFEKATFKEGKWQKEDKDNVTEWGKSKNGKSFPKAFAWIPAQPNSIHNARSMAETRAFNRAVSNLVGGGESSAEEFGEKESESPKTPAKKTTSERNVPQEQITINGSDKPCEHCHAPANKPHASSCKVADVH